MLKLKEFWIGVGLGISAGVSIGCLVARHLLRNRYDIALEEEIRRTKEFFGANYEGSEEFLEDPKNLDAAIKAAESIQEYAGVKVNPSVLAQELETTMKKAADRSLDAAEAVTNPVMREKIMETGRVAYNKMSIVDAEADAIEKLAPRAPQDLDTREPYIITFEEFDAGELGYEQITVSYFAGDGIVIDEVDQVISARRVEETIGTDNLNKFGTNTEDPNFDPNVIYVRCERFNMDFEVTRSPGMHLVEVEGKLPSETG